VSPSCPPSALVWRVGEGDPHNEQLIVVCLARCLRSVLSLDRSLLNWSHDETMRCPRGWPSRGGTAVSRDRTAERKQLIRRCHAGGHGKEARGRQQPCNDTERDDEVRKLSLFCVSLQSGGLRGRRGAWGVGRAGQQTINLRSIYPFPRGT
jgi:hypothetical protein